MQKVNTTEIQKIQRKEYGYQTITINDFDEFIELIRPDKDNLKNYFKYPIRKLIFRGQGNSNWDLVPSFYRYKHPLISITDRLSNLSKMEFNSLCEFVDACDLNATLIPSDSLKLRKALLDRSFDRFDKQEVWPSEDYHELLAFAQHYGLSTQLLDWSKQVLTACYFAASAMINIKDTEDTVNDYFSIWCFNYEMKELLQDNLVIIEVPKSINRNISSQQGCFTLVKQKHSDQITFDDKNKRYNGINLLPDILKNQRELYLLKINIPARYAEKLLDYCSSYSINAATLFRGAKGAVQHTKDHLVRLKLFQEE